MAADAGVDDVELIVALALHRRMTEAELRHAARRPHLRRLRPQRPAHPARCRGPRRPGPPGPDRPGRGRGDQQAGRRERPAGLRQHQPGGHGRRAQERGHRTGQLQEPPPPPQPGHHAAEPVVHGPAPLRAALGQLAHGPAHRRQRGQRSSRSRPPSTTTPSPRRSTSCRSGSGSGASRTGSAIVATSKALDRTPARLARQIFHSVKAPHRMTSVQAGEVEAVHAADHRQRLGPAGRGGRRSDRHPDHGAALHQPLQRQLDPQPDPGGLPRPRLLLQPVPGEAAGPRGRGADHDPPHPVGVQSGPPSELHRLLRTGAQRDHRSRSRWPSGSRSRYATDPWYIHLYRTGHAYHGVHPFYMWYWCAHALQHLGAVIIVGGDPAAVHRLGFRAASTLADALEMAARRGRDRRRT